MVPSPLVVVGGVVAGPVLARLGDVVVVSGLGFVVGCFVVVVVSVSAWGTIVPGYRNPGSLGHFGFGSVGPIFRLVVPCIPVGIPQSMGIRRTGLGTLGGRRSIVEGR